MSSPLSEYAAFSTPNAPTVAERDCHLASWLGGAPPSKGQPPPGLPAVSPFHFSPGWVLPIRFIRAFGEGPHSMLYDLSVSR